MTDDEYIWTDPQRMGGVPCFRGMRVPVRSLFGHLESGYTVDYFVDQFPTVRREQVVELLEAVSKQTDERALAGAEGRRFCSTRTCRTTGDPGRAKKFPTANVGQSTLNCPARRVFARGPGVRRRQQAVDRVRGAAREVRRTETRRRGTKPLWAMRSCG